MENQDLLSQMENQGVQENPMDQPPPAPPKTWDDVRTQRDQMLEWAETQYNFDSPEYIIEAWKAWKQELRDLPAKYADLEDLNQIEWPPLPTVSIQNLNLSRPY